MARSAAQLAHRMSMPHPLCPSSPKPAQSATTTAAALTLTPPLPKTWKDIISM